METHLKTIKSRLKRSLKKSWQFAIALLLMLPLDFKAQEIEVESTYEISGKAKRGDLEHVTYGDDGYKLTYVIRSSKKKLKMEHYTFDADFRFQGLEEEELEVDKVKSKFKWFRGAAEGTRMNLLKVENNMMGQVVLKEGYFYMKCDYYNGVCWWDFKTTDKMKPKDETGRRLTLLAHKTDEPQTAISYSGWSWMSTNTKNFSDATGDLTIVASVLPKIKDAKAGIKVTPYTIMRISVDDKTIKEELDFGDEEFGGKPQALIYQGLMANGNIAMVFAPIGGAGMKKTADPDPLNWRYIEIHPEDVAIVRNINFKSLNSYWRINAIASFGDDVFIYGPAENKKNDKYANVVSGEKFTQFSLAKISGQKMEWITNTHIDEFGEKLKATPGQKKTPEYTGKKFVIGELLVTKNGNIFISGQNIKKTNDGIEFKDLFAFQFDPTGGLKAQYGVELEETNKYAKTQQTTSLFRETQDGKKVSWNVLEIAGYKSMGNERPLMYARISVIDIDAAELSEFKPLGYGKKEKYYLAPSFPILPTTVGGDKMTYFGSDKSGKQIWFCRVAY